MRGMDKTTPVHPVDRLTQVTGTAAELARRLGEFPQNIQNWRKRGIPPEKGAAIEIATGVRCEELWPDLTWVRDEAGAVTGFVTPVAAPVAPEQNAA